MDKRLANKTWRINNLYKIRNKEGKLIKFTRNRTQSHYSSNLHTRNLILKSRQLGFTTDEAIDALDEVLWTPNRDVLLIAHNLEAGESIFNKKISFAWDKLPNEIKNLYKVDNKTSKTLRFDFDKKGFSSIAVDTSGRSGTYHRVHITEFADLCKKFPKKVSDIIEGTIPAIPMTGRIDIESTSQGAGGEFYEMFMEAWERGEPQHPTQYKAHFYNWTWDDEELSRTNKPIPYSKMTQGDKFQEYAIKHNLTDIQITYYYLKWLSLNKRWNALKREYPTTPEEAFDAVSEGTYYGEQIGLMIQNGQIGVYPHERGQKVHTVWDLGVGKNLRIGFFQRDTISGKLKMIDHMIGEGSEGLVDVIPKVFKKPYVYGKHFGPHDLETTDIGSGQTRLKTASGLGIQFKVVEDWSMEDGINAVSDSLDRWYIDKEKCKEFIKSMKAYEREWDDKRGMYKDDPLHNWASHDADMARYTAISENKMTNDSFNPNRPFYDKTIEIWNGK